MAHIVTNCCKDLFFLHYVTEFFYLFFFIVGTDCEFETNSMCGWKNSARDNENFMLSTTSSSPGPKSDHTLGNGNGRFCGFPDTNKMNISK